MTQQWIVDALGAPALFRRLATDMAGTELWSVLMEVVRERARARTPAQVLERHGHVFGRRRVDILTTPERTAVGDRIVAALSDLTVARKPLEHAYYSGGARYTLWVVDPEGTEVPLVDGGAFDWLARLTANRRNAFVASGMGAQLVPLLFSAPPRSPA